MASLTFKRYMRAFVLRLVIGCVLFSGTVPVPFSITASAATVTLAPSPYLTVEDTNGNPVVGALINTYIAGTTTPQATYTDSTGTVANANPIVADSAGRYVAYLTAGASYKFVITTAAGAAIKTVDNISAVPANSGNVDVIGTAGEALTAGQAVYLSDGSGSKAAGQWFKADSANTYSSTLPEVGMAIAAVASGSTVTIRISGLVTGLSSLTIGFPYYIGTGGALTSTAPVNQRLMGVADTTTSLVEVPAAARSQSVPGASTITTTGTQTALGIPSGTGPLVIYANNASLLTIQGITAGIDGQKLTIYSIGAGQVDLVNQSGSASAALRLINIATSGTTSLSAGSGVAEFVYDVTTARWRMTAHDQGAWITPAFSAGNFSGNNSMTWTLIAGNVTMWKYKLTGRTMTVAYSITGTTVGGTASTGLLASFATFGGFAPTNTGFNQRVATTLDNGAIVEASCVVSSGTAIAFAKRDGSNWTLGTNAETGIFIFEVS